jgi:UPF0716 protein FxsA
VGAVTAAVVVGAVVELVLLGVLIWWIGAAWTIALLIAKGVVGYLLVRRAGRRGWRQFRAAIESGRPPGRDVSDAAIGLVGPVLILLTGILGTAVGAALLIPPLRRSAADVVERIVERRISPQVAGSVFGPRWVRVKREAVPTGDASASQTVGPATPTRDASATPTLHAQATGETAADPGPAPAPGGADGVVANPGPVIEGEVLPPR